MSAADMRKAQEEILSMLAGGYHKELIKAQAVFFKEYLKQGFDRDEALELVIRLFCGGKGGKK